ncbi:MAG TPA: ROK family protein [Nitrospira sp.]|nr:ROK family protein [Nitrospira sp.]
MDLRSMHRESVSQKKLAQTASPKRKPSSNQGKLPDQHRKTPAKPTTLVVDVGASGIKAALVNELGNLIGRRLRQDTPPSGRPPDLMDAIVTLVKNFKSFDRVAVGFPGVIVDGIVKQAPNLAPEWKDFNLAEGLRARLKKPIRVANDADVQGFGAIAGKGVELVVTLGTGVGTSLFTDGHLVPNLEIGKDELRNEMLQKDGKKKWNRRLAKFIRRLEAKFHFTRLYIGGGNSKAVDISLLPAHVTIVSNLNGLVGGIALWRDQVVPIKKHAVDPGPIPVAER